MPIATDRLITLPPGRNWHSPSRSVNSAALSQRCCSTKVRRASGSAPPNDVRPNLRNPLKISPTVGTASAVDIEAGATGVSGVSSDSGAEEEEC
ncbi:hypothetical protein LMG29542_08747 [Paraburkholderia humisilvae]|uniref:Uncharacterized protein n=1 Tax=Paraburkholderia humisilvae TaxID=627669 RepID=A0A6J5FDU1_9BURK|nr:hypothetical protein LMG29542_08747 [Paraburkholderia humisilvae]